MRLLKALFAALILAVAAPQIDAPRQYSAAYAVEVDLQFLKGTQFLDSTGAPLSLGTINIYDSGTTSLRTTYSERTGVTANTLNGSNQIVLDSGGRLSESVYIPTGAWKFVLKDSSGSTIVTEDNIEGALDTSAFTVTSAKPEMPVISKTADYTVTSSDLGKCINANPTGGNFTITMLSAATAGDGKTLCLRHTGTSGRVTIATSSSQTINSKATYVLESQHKTSWLVSDGANWHVVSNSNPLGSEIITITDRLTAPPSSPTPGACYIINGSTPTGVWASYAQHDVVCATGTGSWSKYTPSDGWVGYVTDETMLTQFRTNAWVDLSAVTAPSTSNLRQFLLRSAQPSGTTGGTATTGAWTRRLLNVTDALTITTADGATGTASVNTSTGVITLPAGTYDFAFGLVFSAPALVSARIQNTTDGTTVGFATNGKNNIAVGGVNFTISGHGRTTITSEKTFELQYHVSASGGTADLGAANSISGVSETYGFVKITDLAAAQGPQGSQGAQGATGYTGHPYTYSNSTTLADPGAGVVRLSSTTLSAITAIAIDATSAASGNPDVSDDISTWSGDRLQIRKVGSEQNFVILEINSLVDNGGWLQLNGSVIASSGSLTDADSLSVTVQPRGEVGATGSSVPPIDMQFNTATSGDPGSGKILFNNSTLSSVTSINISETDRLAVDVAGLINSFDDLGASANRGTLYVYATATPITRAVFTVTGSVTDNGTYGSFAVTHLTSNGTFTNNGNVTVLFVPTGATGAAGSISGPASSTDNAIVRWNGAPGTTIQDSGITISDLNAITGVNTLELSGNLTAVTGTLHTNSGNITTNSGKVKENNVNISPIGKHTIFIPAGAMLARNTSGCALSSVTETSTNKVNTKSMDCDATTPEYFQFQFTAPASFNLSTITYQAYWMHGSTTTNFGVIWGLQCQGLGDNEAVDTAFGTMITVADTGGTFNNLYRTAESGALTIANVAAGDLVFCQGYREAHNASDTLAIDARLIGLKLLYTTSAATDD